MIGATAYSVGTMSARLAGEIVKPKDWQAFQRACVVLFREELRDPNCKEYGRHGQKQGGIDIFGHRNGDPTRPVGVQCRRYGASLKEKDLLADCRAALELDFGLRELLFVTTAKDDTRHEHAAKSIQRQLRAEGHDVVVHVYGWGQLETLIGMHEAAYNAFMPLTVATTRPLDLTATAAQDLGGLAALVADAVAQRMSGTIVVAPEIAGPDGIGSESPGLHARIDILRDLVKAGEARAAEYPLVSLRDSDDARDAPWARYRIENNLAAAYMERGLEEEAAAAYVRAHAIRPEDPNALANLALARTMQGAPEEGMRVAQAALARADRSEFAVSALLQSAARTEWQGDPEDLIPEDLRSSAVAQTALADFKRRRWLPGWERQVLALAAGNDLDLRRTQALAVLSIAIDSRLHVAGASDAVSDAQVHEAATCMLVHAKRYLHVGYRANHDLMAVVSNAALLLRIGDRNDEAEALLREGLVALPGDEQFSRLLAMIYVDRGQRDEALRLIDAGVEPETQLMKAQFGRTGSAADRLAQLQAMAEPEDARVAGMRRRLMAEFALRAGDEKAVASIVHDMRGREDDRVAGELIAVEASHKGGLDDDEVRDRVRAIAVTLPEDGNPLDRFLVAEAMLLHGLEAEAADLIERHIDLASARPSTLLYLTALAESRRDAAYRAALQRAAPAVRNDPNTLWLDARHAWNTGDIVRSLASLDRFLAGKPSEPRAVLMRLEVLIRLGRSADVLAAIEEPIEGLAWGPGDHLFRVAGLLIEFGQHARAARLAYRLFLERRDKPRAWMTLSALTLRENQGPGGRDAAWSVAVVGPEAGVDIRYDDGETAFFVVEPDPHLRGLDPESWEPDHALVRAAAGQRVGDWFTAPDGRAAEITQLRHKIVARFHYVLANYERRFPEVFGFKSLSIDPERPDGLDEMIAELKERHDWVLAEQDQWLSSGQPMDVLAKRIGVDTIDVAAGLAAQGLKLPVAAGTDPERATGVRTIRSHRRGGCVLDLATFWTAWRLRALEELAATCGDVAVPRSVVDRLQARRARLALTADRGAGTLSYLDGKVLHTETPPEIGAQFRDEVDASLAWIEATGAAEPVVVSDDLPDSVRDVLRSGITDMFDAGALAAASGRILVSDDMALRAVQTILGGKAVWLHLALGEAYVAGKLDARDLIERTVALIEAGQQHLSLSGTMIALGMEMDVQERGELGRRATALVSRLGGAEAEPRSHVLAVCGAMGQLWSTHSVHKVRERATGMLLEAVLRKRSDWAAMLAAIEKLGSQHPAMLLYVRGWARGHFLPGYV